jgi:hypothetical protein
MKLRGSKIGVAIMVAVLVFFSTCELPPSFGPEYYDSSINYIVAFPLAAPDAVYDSELREETGLPAAWDWAWRRKMENEFAYMSLTPAGENRLGGGPAWILELANLFANGTYEAELTEGQYGTVGANVSITREFGQINGTSLKIATDPQTYARMNMAAILIDEPVDSFEYYIRLLVEPKSTFSFRSLSGPGTTQEPDGITGSLFLTDAFSNFGALGPGFSIGSESSAFNLNIDEVRVVRADHQSDMRLRLLLRPQDTYPTLVMGHYKFSLWARIPPGYLRFDDMDARNIDSDTANAPYAAPSITLTINQLLSTAGGKGGNSFTFPISDIWQKIELDLPRSSNIEIFNEKLTLPVLELSILPGAPGQAMDAGAVMIADPSLNFFLNNY